MRSQRQIRTAEENSERNSPTLLRWSLLVILTFCYGAFNIQVLSNVNNSNIDRISREVVASPSSIATTPEQTSNKQSASLGSFNLLAPQQGVRQDSSDATVMGMAQGYDLKVHRRFVGSLRNTGFKGSM